jgi:peptide/nickel transport system permease protein
METLSNNYLEKVNLTPKDKFLRALGGVRQGWKVFGRNKLAVLSLFILIVIIGFCFIGPYLYHTNQTNLAANLGQICNQPPSKGHPLGTDGNCFDMLGRLMVGGQSSFIVGFLASIIAVTFGALYGVVAGFTGGALDTLLMRVLDALLAIPGLYLVIDVVSIFGRNRSMMIAIIGFTGWYGVARILRAEALTIREREYVQAVKVMGGSTSRIIFRHMLPNSLTTLTTLTTFAIGDSILALAGLGFLGIGLQLPQTDWGTLLNTSLAAILLNFWWQVWPVMILFLTVVVCINYMGDAMRDAFEVRLRER